jgi:hypothetical protein
LTLRLNSFISSNRELSQISGKVRQLRAFQQHYKQITPPSLSRSSQVMQIELGVLTLAANNSAVAAKLRQMTPELLRQLQLQGCEVTGIQVRVQVTQPAVPKPHITHKISNQGKQTITELADKLADTPLRRALQRLIGNKQGQ